MPDSSSEHEEAVEDDKVPDTQLKVKTQERALSTSKRRLRSTSYRVRPRLEHARGVTDVQSVEDIPHPEAYYRQFEPHLVPPAAPQPPLNVHQYPEEASDSSDNESGYDFLASRISTAAVPPLYRKFTTINHRILLHLQDEIAKMEEELHFLDQAESQCRAAEERATGQPIAPASRRLMPRSQRHNEIYFQKLDLLRRLSIVVEQYSTSKKKTPTSSRP